MNPARNRDLTIMVVPEDGRASRTYRLPYRWLCFWIAFGVVGIVGVTGMAASWWYLAARASLVDGLELRLEAMDRDRVRLDEIAAELAVAEAQYERVRALVAPEVLPDNGGLWLPPAGGANSDRGSENLPVAVSTLPTVWPLTEKGLVTQGLLDGEEGEHPGLDIAVQTDSYVRAAGGGIIAEVNIDEVYGRFVVIDHGSGYTTVYAHISAQLVVQGQRVREREVIALSGSSGQSTAPHLHFEILLDGSPVDPLSMVQQPN